MPSASSTPADSDQAVPSSAGQPGWFVDAAWGLAIALLVLALLVFSASPFRSDRGFIYIDF